MKSKMVMVLLAGMILVVLGIASATMALDTDLENENSSDSGNKHECNGMFNERNSEIRMARESGDLDSDGIANCEDPDDDGDGINDTKDEFPHDHDNDGIPDPKDDDDDNDDIPDDEDDEYVGNCLKPDRKFGHRKHHQRSKKSQNRTFIVERMQFM